MNIDPAFGNRIKELRKAKNFLLRELATKANMDYTYLSKIENAKMPPPRKDVIESLAKVLDANTDELLALAGRTPPSMLSSEPARKFLFRHAPHLKDEDWEKILRVVEQQEKS